MTKHFLADTCFWLALYDVSDEHHQTAQDIMQRCSMSDKILIPFPVLYETLNTRFVKHKEWLLNFNALLKRDATVRICDEPYKERALATVLGEKRPISLVDRIIRLMIDDNNLQVTALITFNRRDFYDVGSRRQQFELIDC